MQRYMSEAVAVVESGPWLDSEMRPSGRRLTIITATRDQTLSAVVLFKKDADASVLEFSSHCLRNLLALGIRPSKPPLRSPISNTTSRHSVSLTSTSGRSRSAAHFSHDAALRCRKILSSVGRSAFLMPNSDSSFSAKCGSSAAIAIHPSLAR